MPEWIALWRQWKYSRFFIHQLRMVQGDHNLSSHSYMHYEEGMCRITALLEIEKNSVNIETVGIIYWKKNELVFFCLTSKVSLSNSLAGFSWFKINAVIFHFGISSHLPYILKNMDVWLICAIIQPSLLFLTLASPLHPLTFLPSPSLLYSFAFPSLSLVYPENFSCNQKYPARSVSQILNSLH